MTIQVGVPGAAGGGGGGGGGGSEIALAGGRVTVEADGSITLQPAPGEKVIRLKGVANNSAPLLEWDDDFGSPDFFVGVETGAGDHMDDTSSSSKIVAAGGTLHIGILGEVSSFDITTSGVEMKAPRWLLTAPGPHAWGQQFAGNDRQFEFAGAYTGGGFSAALRKFLISGNLLGFDGDTDGLFGLEVSPAFITQTEIEDIDLIANIRIPISTIQDNLTGAILETAGLFIEGPMAEGNANYAVLAPAGLSKFDTLWAAGIGPHAFGRSSVPLTSQFVFGGAYVGSGSDLSKLQIENSLTGVSGTQRYRGLHVSVSMLTQANTDTIFNMSLVDLVVPNITDNLTGGVGIVQAATLRIQGAPTEGNTNFALIVEDGLTALKQMLVDDIGPHAFGVAAIEADKQFLFGGDITLTGGAPTKFNLRDRIIGSAGASQYAGLKLNVEFQTQTVDEEVDVMAGLDISAPQIVNNLLGGNTVLEAFSVRIQGPPTGADDNWAFKVDNGLSEFDDALVGRSASSVGFFGTGPVSRPTGVAVTDAAIHAALVTLGLITA